jgi:hypothetical protein
MSCLNISPVDWCTTVNAVCPFESPTFLPACPEVASSRRMHCWSQLVIVANMQQRSMGKELMVPIIQLWSTAKAISLTASPVRRHTCLVGYFPYIPLSRRCLILFTENVEHIHDVLPAGQGSHQVQPVDISRHRIGVIRCDDIFLILNVLNTSPCFCSTFVR